ncbi:hypothetical protein KUCAC02_020683 [Chaenocephalus aceratus]|uniref:Uncharacterized protein n=1 Tax=Chaenocephalus aceratus TaxID=36190 RepID=A0ACB9XFC8_CHAAC|nr:hypothetical protein KUCAC02_020683 [Chaenocephalus aceratus]
MANFVPDRTSTQIGRTTESPDKEFVLLVGAHISVPSSMECEDAKGKQNLTSSRTITEAGVDFGKLLATAMSRWPNVFALDFVPRLTVDPDYQDMMRQEFRRVAARVKDGVHLSDSKITACQRVTPRVIVKGEVAKSPQPDPSKWTVIGQGRKRSQHDEPEQSIDALNKQGLFSRSSAMLVEMDKISPSHLPGPDECTPPVQNGKESKDGAEAEGSCLQEDPGNATGGGSPMVVEVILRPPTSTGTVAVEQQVEPFPGLEPSPGVEPLASVEPSLSVEPSPSNEPSLA